MTVQSEILHFLDFALSFSPILLFSQYQFLPFPLSPEGRRLSTSHRAHQEKGLAPVASHGHAPRIGILFIAFRKSSVMHHRHRC